MGENNRHSQDKGICVHCHVPGNLCNVCKSAIFCEITYAINYSSKDKDSVMVHLQIRSLQKLLVKPLTKYTDTLGAQCSNRQEVLETC